MFVAWDRYMTADFVLMQLDKTRRWSVHGSLHSLCHSMTFIHSFIHSFANWLAPYCCVASRMRDGGLSRRLPSCNAGTWLSIQSWHYRRHTSVEVMFWHAGLSVCLFVCQGSFGVVMGHLRSLIMVVRSTQSSTLSGMVNEYQHSGRVITIDGDGGCRW